MVCVSHSETGCEGVRIDGELRGVLSEEFGRAAGGAGTQEDAM